MNNTGVNAGHGPMVELDLGAARKTLEVNCIAALSWVQQVHRAWMKEHGSAVVNVSITELLAAELSPETSASTRWHRPW